MGRLVAWTLVMVLLVYTHMFGLLFLAAFAVINWLYGARRWIFTPAAAIPGLAFVPWLVYVLPVYFACGLDANLTWVNKQLHRAVILLPYGFLGFIHAPGLRTHFIAASAVLHLVLFVLAWRAIRQVWPPRRDEGDTARWFWTVALLVVVPAYWLLVVRLAQFGDRAGLTVLYGIVLPWVLVGIGSALAEQLPRSPARQDSLLLSHEMQEGDMILCEGQDLANQVYWEWTRRLGSSDHIEVLQTPWAMVRLSVLPPKDLDTLELGAVDRVWFFSNTASKKALVTEFLKTRGLDLQKQLQVRGSFLLAFAKESQP
jgi:hypothetical protein